MGDSSKIQWTDATWNPVTGCTKVSPGCANCYIDRTPPFRIAGRRFVGGSIPLVFHEDRLDQPLRWTRPRRVFVNSLSDLFHPDVPDVFVDKVFAVMALAKRHTFQVLTKRADRMREYSRRWNSRMMIEAAAASMGEYGLVVNGKRTYSWPLPNVWLGVSVENQRIANARIPVLLQTRAAVRFISAEPLLESVDLSRLMVPTQGGASVWNALTGTRGHMAGWDPTGIKLDWVIVGGESGPRSRTFDIAWGQAVVDQCRSAGVPVFVKQLGQAPIHQSPGGTWFTLDLQATKGGDIDEWPEGLRVREYPLEAPR